MNVQFRSRAVGRATSLVCAALLAVAAVARAQQPAEAPVAPPAPAAPAAPAPSPATPPAAGTPGAEPPPYTVIDGDKVDAGTFEGWKTWRAMACERCHGATQDGLVGPSLNADLQVISKDDFIACVLSGRIDKGMPNFGTTQRVLDNLDNLYAFLKGRSDGKIKAGHLHKIEN